LKSKTHLPVIVDPTHALGLREFVPQMCLAAVAAGADALMIEVHDSPEMAKSDGNQALTPEISPSSFRVFAPLPRPSVARCSRLAVSRRSPRRPHGGTSAVATKARVQPHNYRAFSHRRGYNSPGIWRKLYSGKTNRERASGTRRGEAETIARKLHAIRDAQWPVQFSHVIQPAQPFLAAIIRTPGISDHPIIGTRRFRDLDPLSQRSFSRGRSTKVCSTGNRMRFSSRKQSLERPKMFCRIRKLPPNDWRSLCKSDAEPGNTSS